MTGIFKQKTPGNIILLCMVGILLKLPSFANSTGVIVKNSDSVLYIATIHFLKSFSNSGLFFTIIAFSINFLIAAILTGFTNSERLMGKPNFLAGMSYILITSFLPSFNILSSNLIASILLLSAFSLIYKSYYTRNNIFNAAFLIGLASLFFFPAIFFIVWLFLALAVLRPFRLSEWIGLILGATTPYYFYAAYLFMSDQWYIPKYFYALSFLSSTVKYSLWHAGTLFLLLAPLLTGIYYMQVNAAKMLTHVRKGWYLFLGYLVMSIVVSLFDVEKTSENLILGLVPIAAFHGYGYLNAELRLYPKIAFWVTVIFIVAGQLYGNFGN